MKKKLAVILILSSACLQFAWHGGNEKNMAVSAVRKRVLLELKLLKENLAAIAKPQNINTKKTHYAAARKHYKHIEFFVEYYSPLDAKLYINGPLVPKHEIDLGKNIIAPQGFQRVEEILYNSGSGLKKELALLQEQISKLENYYKDVEVTDGALLEMCQLQLFRVAALGLNGYDAAISQTNITEALWSFEGIENTVKQFEPYTKQRQPLKKCLAELQEKITYGKSLLNQNKSYNTFNRLEFITKIINPVNGLLVTFHNLTGLPWNENKKALQLQNGFLFGNNSFNPQFFSIYYDDTVHINEQASLGKLLFNDPILSGNNQYACASCHNPGKAFSDGLAKSISINGEALARNAPSLLNVIYQKAFFYDGRACQLEQQVLDVVHNAAEMNSSLQSAVSRLQQNEKYKKLFKSAFANTTHDTITEYAVQKSLAEYEKTLVSFSSRFDKYLSGDTTALTAREINGYNIFAGKALCGSCHFFPLFNGTVPPYFTDSEFEVIGTPAGPDNKMVDSDEGRFAVTGLSLHLYSFKTPTVRNTELTAPYMHNGVYSTFEDVIEFYRRGGGNGFGFNIPNQTLPFDSLKLSSTEKESIIFFLKSLTDISGKY